MKLTVEIERLESDAKATQEKILNSSNQYHKKDLYRHIRKVNKKLNKLYSIRRNLYGY